MQKYTDICFQTASRMQFLGVKKWCSATVFSDTKQKHSSQKGFFLHISFNIKWVEVRKNSETFWAKRYCKISDLFCWFLLVLRLSARRSAIKKNFDAHWNIWIKIKTRDFDSFIFWSKFRFFGEIALGCFSQCFFFIFCRRSTMVADTFLLYPLPPFAPVQHKKLPMVLLKVV